MSFSVTPFKAQNDFVLALYKFDNEGVAIKYTGDMHAIDYALAEGFSIESSLPNIWMFSYNEALFVDGTPLFDDVFGYYFEPDGTAGRVYSAFEESYFVGDGELYNFQWTMDSNEVNIVGVRENSAFVFNREYTWKLLGSKQEGIVATLEMQSNKVDYTDEFNENLVFNILPRLSFTFKLNLEEQYPEFWENTDIGSLNTPDISVSISLYCAYHQRAFTKNFPNLKNQNNIRTNSTPAIKPHAYSHPAGKKHALKYWGQSTFLPPVLSVHWLLKPVNKVLSSCYLPFNTA